MIQPSSERIFIVSLHDVTPLYSAEIYEIMSELDALNVKGVSLLAVPEYHGNALNSDDTFNSWLQDRSDRGDEIVLHGWRHIEHGKPKGLIRNIRRSLFTRGEGEFLGIDSQTCETYIENGLQLFQSMHLKTEGFVAPAWLIEKKLYSVLKDKDLIYTTRQSGIVNLSNNQTISSPAIVLRGSSLLMNRLSRFFNNIFLALLQNTRVIRIAIHPADVRFKANSWYKQIISKLQESRTSLTYSAFINRIIDRRI